MANCSAAVFSIDHLLNHLPENPIKEHLANAWIDMTTNYTKFQIVIWGSLILHESLSTGECVTVAVGRMDVKPDTTILTASKYVEELRQRLEMGWNLAVKNLKQARQKHAAYFNRKAKDRDMVPRDKVLLLLPQGANKLEIAWQGPYSVVEKISRTNYRISMKGKQKIYHVNLLRKYHERAVDQQAHLLAMAIATEVEGGEAVPAEYPLKPCGTFTDVVINDSLRSQQIERLQRIVQENARVLTDKPGLTDLVEFDMKLTSADPVRIRPYPTSLAKEEVLKAEVEYLLKEGIIFPSESPHTTNLEPIGHA